MAGEPRRTILSSLANLFSGAKKRHNTEAAALEGLSTGRGPTGQRLTRAEFLSVYQSMPEESRAELFASLDFRQKKRLLELLTPDKNAEAQNAKAPEDSQWAAEDFLPEKDEAKIARLRQVRELRELRALFARFEECDPAAVAEVLAHEIPPVAAIALLQLGEKPASKILKQMPELKRGEIVRAMAAERQVSSEVLLALAKKMQQKIDELPAATMMKVDGVRHVNEILKLLGAEEADRITREVAEHDADLAGHLEQHRYQFEDLVELNARDFRTLFSALPDEQLWARALKAVDQSQRKALLGKLPLKRAGMIAEAMASIKTTRLDSIDKARGKILHQALKMAARHEIRFAGNGLH